MSVKNWTGTTWFPTDSFNNPDNWTPTGAPIPDDIANITSGLVLDSTSALSDLTINLGAVGASPDLWIMGAGSIASDTLIELPQTPVSLGETFNGDLDLEGNVTYSGTIGLLTNASGPSKFELRFNSDFGPGQTPVNRGTINIAPDQSAIFLGDAISSNRDAFSGGDIIKGGIINIAGTVFDWGLSFDGAGTINLDAISTGPGLPAKPAFLVDNYLSFGGGRQHRFHATDYVQWRKPDHRRWRVSARNDSQLRE